MLSLREGAERLVSKLREAGYEAYFAGGCVRDQLLGLDPKDYDIVTSARPDEVTALFDHAVEVGVAFGVVRVRLERGLEYEVATYREEGAYSDGRHPDEVRYAESPQKDVERRDFTINALLYDPDADRVLDWVGGERDLKAQTIRAVGDPEQRFSEDRLRMLRAVRFAARLGFVIEKETADAIRRHASELHAVSVERIVQELDGIFLSPRPAEGLRLLIETGLLPHALVVTQSYTQDDWARWAGRFCRLSSAILGREERLDVAWAASIDPLDSDAIEEAMRALKHSRARLRGVLRVRAVMADLASASAPQDAAVMRVASLDDARAWFNASQVWFGHASQEALRFESAMRDVADRPLPERPILSGGDLRALGLTPGPRFKRILAAVDDAVLERSVTDRPGALRLARTLAERSD